MDHGPRKNPLQFGVDFDKEVDLGICIFLTLQNRIFFELGYC